MVSDSELSKGGTDNVVMRGSTSRLLIIVILCDESLIKMVDIQNLKQNCKLRHSKDYRKVIHRYPSFGFSGVRYSTDYSFPSASPKYQLEIRFFQHFTNHLIPPFIIKTMNMPFIHIFDKQFVMLNYVETIYNR